MMPKWDRIAVFQRVSGRTGVAVAVDNCAPSGKRSGMIQTLPLAALGGAIGAALRHMTNETALRLVGPGFPFGTLVVNVVGSLLMGALA